jgi:uncharacterized damage-inducible protein DinB
MEDLRYPIGQFEWDGVAISPTHIEEWIAQINVAPVRLRAAVEHLSAEQLDTPYRPGGWTVRQVVHHVPDSHLNSYVRFRLALTESEPTIRPYDEARWAELSDARTAPIEMSLNLLSALHERWTTLMGAFEPSDWSRTFRHPALGVMTLERATALYAWHGRHHVAQITSLGKRLGWS